MSLPPPYDMPDSRGGLITRGVERLQPNVAAQRYYRRLAATADIVEARRHDPQARMVASIAIAYSSVMHMHLAPSEEAGMKIVLAIRDSHLYDPPAAGRILECLQAFQDESGDFGGSLLRAFYDKGTDQKPQLIEFAPEAPLSAVRSMQRSMGKAAAKEKFYPTTDSGYRLKVDSLVGDTEALQLAVLLAAESDTDSGYMLVDHIDGTFRYSLAESSTDTQL